MCTCGLSLSPERDGADDSGVEDEVWRVLGYATQQAADALADVGLGVVQSGEQLRNDAFKNKQQPKKRSTLE